MNDWDIAEEINVYYDKIYIEQLFSYAIFNIELNAKVFMKNFIPEKRNGYLIYFSHVSNSNSNLYYRISNGFRESILIEYDSPIDLIKKTIDIIKEIKNELDGDYTKIISDIERGKIGFISNLNVSNESNDVLFTFTLIFFVEKLLGVKNYTKFITLINVITEYIQVYYFSGSKRILIIEDYVIVMFENILFPMPKDIYTIFNKKYDGYVFLYKFSLFVILSKPLFKKIGEKSFEFLKMVNDLKVYENDEYYVIIDDENVILPLLVKMSNMGDKNENVR